MSLHSDHLIDRAVDLLMEAEGARRLCQRDLLEIRREGPRTSRLSSARGYLQQCRLARHLSTTAAARLRAAHGEEAA